MEQNQIFTNTFNHDTEEGNVYPIICEIKYILTLENYLMKNRSIVMTVKKDQSINLALDSKILNKAFHKSKY